MKFLNSFRFQLTVILIGFALVLTFSALQGIGISEYGLAEHQFSDMVNEQVRLVLEIIIDAHQIIDVTDNQEELAGLLTKVNEEISDFDQIMSTLLDNNSEISKKFVLSPQLFSLLEFSATKWTPFKNSIQTLTTQYTAPDTDTEAKERFIHQIELLGFALQDSVVEFNTNIDLLLHDFKVTTTRMTVVLAVVTAVSILLAFYLMNRLVKSVSNLSNTAIKLGSGNLRTRVSLNGTTEINAVSHVFNQMAEQVEQRIIEAEAARTKAERAEKVKTTFLASMSHELRTPLNAIINFTQFVKDGDLGSINEPQSDLLGEVIGSGKHLLNLINDVLDMSKIEAGSLTLFVEDNVELEGILSTVVTTGRGLLMNRDVTIKTEIEPNLPFLSIDRQRIIQVLLNIVSNACKFTEKGEICLKAFQANNEIVIAIRDTGPGIAVEDQHLVFEPFKQTTTGLRQAGGTGLGMPIAKNLAEANGGRLWLESQLGNGATFYLALPIKFQTLTAP